MVRRGKGREQKSVRRTAESTAATRAAGQNRRSSVQQHRGRQQQQEDGLLVYGAEKMKLPGVTVTSATVWSAARSPRPILRP